MAENITGISVKHPDLFFSWADKAKLRITVISMDYPLIHHTNDGIVVNNNSSSSQYYLETAFRCLGKTATIKTLILVINQDLKLEAEDFSPIQLEPGDYYKCKAIFLVKGGLDVMATAQGTFDLIAIDTFGKTHECRGKFPIG